MLNRQTRRAMARRGREDPAWWVRNILGGNPWAMQTRVFESVRDNVETAVASCHSAGKSWLASRVVMWFLYNFAHSIVVTTAPTERQVQGILWKEIGIAHAGARVPLGGTPLLTKLNLDRDWYAWGFTGRPDGDGSSIQGFHAKYLLVVVDEAAGIDGATEEALDSMMASGVVVRKLMIGNPTRPLGPFAEAFKPRSSANAIRISAFDTPNFTKFGITLDDIRDGSWKEKVEGEELPAPHLCTPQWVAGRLEKWGEHSPMFQARVLARFPEADDNALIPLHLIEAAMERNLEASGISRLGVDIARTGSDESVVYHRRGPVFRLLDTWRKALRAQENAARVAYHLRETDAGAAVVDVVGVGAGTVDVLYGDGEPVVACNAGDASADDDNRFANLRAELYWTLREMAEAGELDLDPDDEEIAAQLSSIRYGYQRRSGKLLIEAKESIKKRGLPSPDRADALVHTLVPVDYDSDAGKFEPAIV